MLFVDYLVHSFFLSLSASVLFSLQLRISWIYCCHEARHQQQEQEQVEVDTEEKSLRSLHGEDSTEGRKPSSGEPCTLAVFWFGSALWLLQIELLSMLEHRTGG